MAKWGEGDPRWIVEERPDATNVNNWHWAEKNATPWSKDRIRSLFDSFEIKSSDDKTGNIDCKVINVESIDGEATANNRKGKLIFFYEWNITLKWNGILAGQEKVCEGKVNIPNLSEENDLDDVEIQVTTNESTDESYKLKQFMYNIGRDQIRKQLGVYLKELREEFSKGLILPKKDEEKTVKTDGVSNISNAFNKKINMQPLVSSEKPLGYKIAVTDVTISGRFMCRVNEIYDVWTKEELVTAFTHAPCKVDAVKGGIFELFGGNIHGKFEELIPNKKIVQSWRYNQWPSGHFSNVTIEFKERSDHTKVCITQTGVPENEKDATYKNWKGYYLNSIKQTFGFGTFLM